MTDEEIQAEALRAGYLLRASFYYRQRRRWGDLLRLLERAASAPLQWGERSSWGLEEAAWQYVHEQNLNPALVFCHPDVLRQHPGLGTYYRSLALLSQKGLARLGGGSAAFEDNPAAAVKLERAVVYARTVNAILSQIIRSDPAWNLEEARIAALLNLGSQVNGSWRNAVGIEGTRRARDLVLALLRERSAIAEIRGTSGRSIPIEQATGESVRELRLTNGYLVVFGSEPDIGVYDPEGKPILTVEVKAGLDPAGALERYGAAKKSFDHAVAANSRVHNILLASCVTPEVRKRMDADRLVNADLNLTAILASPEDRERVVRHVGQRLGL